ncbi:heme lyase CcmF/NrfE family subunit [Amphiplicatus metriothermophilus]|uniref:Cytochrome c-type biogenesis protein CcmF n=1 Tax=Amphiplicatus metriothermophilus TaxID=1519374 RepID=A0A239PU15_9PROT|nr:heme lyase CcmF/NrfE family subunit [Amphiplicatus metriothermophilus]MBB5519317.1 cytochrome c-type biogenesis protein CcmF [Amphiplicatus metriothermophilus]SNT73386.1 cytochrome c-type biogenesis protein CcmF [Amphiplicatus metriothermophilus]
MIPEIGHFALALAFAAALAQGPALYAAARADDERLAAFGRRCAYLALGAVGLAFASLAAAYVASDFSVLNVYENSHSQKPLIYKFTGTWGNHEGSMLLWALILALYGGALARQARAIPADLHRLALGTQGLIAAAFLAFMLFTSNPFERLLPAPPDGADLNPLLQDIGLALHPPFLYLGYVGFSVPFSFAVAALIRGRADSVWARLVRPWALAAWSFLTVGIALGSWWAYYELGWGGWWAWDPVENASFMPWLAGTALIHSIRVVERRDALKGWATLLAIAAFSLSLIGTFLVRSGVLTSIHAFAVDPERGVFILAILFAAVGGSLTVYALRAGSLAPTGAFAPASRETALIANNVLLAAACATVFIGTFYPLFVDVATGERISVGPPYFNMVFTPIAALAMALAAAGALMAWKRADLRALARRLAPAGAAALVAALIVAVVAEREKAAGAGWVALCVWLAGGALADLAGRVKLFGAAPGAAARRLAGLPRAAVGAALAHFGLAVFALGAAGVGLWRTEEVRLMKEGDAAHVAGYAVMLASVENTTGPNYLAERARFEARKGARETTLISERRYYPVRGMQTTEAGIRSQGGGDLYVSLGENATGEGWAVRLYFNPFVGCLWWGAGLAALGGALALSDRGRAPARAARGAAASPRAAAAEAPA